MTFNSSQFLFFLPMFLVLYAVVFRREAWRDLLLLVASYFFYMCWNWRYGALLLISTSIDYVIGRGLARLEEPRSRRRLLILSVTVNLGVLAVFKYFNFFMSLAH